MLACLPRFAVVLFGCTLAVRALAAPADLTPAQLDAQFQRDVKPFVQTYCISCHGADKPKAGLNFNSFTDLASVTKNIRRWTVVLRQLKDQAMPPEDAKPQPTPAQREQITTWIQALTNSEAKRNAGDPGPVLTRRLSNAEYDYTIRDLTGMDLRPTREFPVDPANEAGFDNSGESLAMSPALVKKYLDAAQLVANHIVFLPNGFAFSPMAMVTEEDRDNYAVHRIVDFYRQRGLTVDQRVGTYMMGEFLDYAPYFQAAWSYKNRAALGKPNATLADFAKDANLSPKYLDKIWTTLTADAGSVGPIAALQTRWNGLPTPVDGKMPDAVPTGCGYIRDLIVSLRPLVARDFENFPTGGIANGSQSLVLWKDRQFAENRQTYADNAQLLDMSGYAATDPALVIPATDEARAQYEESFKQFCATFPDAFAVWERSRMFLAKTSREVTVDLQGHRLLTAGFHSQMGYFRDDQPLRNLVLDDAQNHELDRLWDELAFVTAYPNRQFKQFLWFERAEPPSFMATGEFNSFRSEDDDITTEAKINALAATYLEKARNSRVTPAAQEIVQDYFNRMNASIRQLDKVRQAAEPAHLNSLLDFAAQAYRRPLTSGEKNDLLAFYQSLRAENLGHEDAMRDTVVSILMSPYYALRIDEPLNALVAKTSTRPLTDYELASRLSYFLWASQPDKELLAHAAAGDLHQPAVLLAQAHRMIQDGRIRDFATEFGGNWLDVRRFEEHNAVDRDRFPAFTNDLREAMFQEPIRYIVDVVQHNRSVLDFLYGNDTFVNPVLARHYGMPEPAGGADTWVHIDDAQPYQRGGLLPMAAFLTKNAPGLRTSPVKRGYWVVRRLLGQEIPAPPPNVPVLPTDETKLGDLTLRQTLARHREDPSCAVCHEKFDSFGLVFEGYGPVGEIRTRDLGDRPVEITATFPDGSEGAGLSGLRAYLKAKRQEDFLDKLCRDMVVYALGRTLLPSDEPLVADLHQKLAANGYRFGTLVDNIVTSPQFLNKRNLPDS